MVTSKHEGFEQLRDLEPNYHDHEFSEEEDEIIHEGIVLHTCETAMFEMLAIGRIDELIEMFARVIVKKKGEEIGNVKKRTGVNATFVQSKPCLNY